ncbi:integral membrane protein [Neisseria gonorrhoeae]|uniref:Integral membrane protein n=1 Tax=Neisseria gonorrhoeae TaxID=485 RepID=A0A379B272_NEIGO|nr:integral membrane protein [Neisseria gonorrhoeae]
MAMYVIDAREPVLDKYRDELTILSWCAKPVMPVFNFTGGQLPESWTTMLARRNLHVFAGFDTVAFDLKANCACGKTSPPCCPNAAHLTA